MPFPREETTPPVMKTYRAMGIHRLAAAKSIPPEKNPAASDFSLSGCSILLPAGHANKKAGATAGFRYQRYENAIRCTTTSVPILTRL
jgi:hypothetical protein